MSLHFALDSVTGPGDLSLEAAPNSIVCAEVSPRAVMSFTARLHHDRASIESVWVLFQAEGTCTAYQRLDWVSCMSDHLLDAAHARPIFVEVIDQATGRSVMLFPFVLLRRSGLRIINWLDLGVCDYAAPLMAPLLSLSPEESERAWMAVHSALPKADLIDIRNITPNIDGIANPLALIRRHQPMDLQSMGIVLGGDPATFLHRTMGRRNHHDLSRRRRRLNERGAVAFVEAKTEAEVTSLFDEMMRQRRKRFQQLGRFDLLARPDTEAFYRAAAIQGVNGHGPGRMFGLALDGEWISISFILVHARVVHGIIITMAGDEWIKFSPGLLLMSELLQWSIDNDYAFFDMTVGSLSYKGDFGAKSLRLGRVIEPRTLLGRGAVLIMVAAAAVMSNIRRNPKLFGYLRSVRQMCRRGLRKPAAGQKARAGR